MTTNSIVDDSRRRLQQELDFHVSQRDELTLLVDEANIKIADHTKIIDGVRAALAAIDYDPSTVDQAKPETIAVRAKRLGLGFNLRPDGVTDEEFAIAAAALKQAAQEFNPDGGSDDLDAERIDYINRHVR